MVNRKHRLAVLLSCDFLDKGAEDHKRVREAPGFLVLLKDLQLVLVILSLGTALTRSLLDLLRECLVLLELIHKLLHDVPHPLIRKAYILLLLLEKAKQCAIALPRLESVVDCWSAYCVEMPRPQLVVEVLRQLSDFKMLLELFTLRPGSLLVVHE